MANRWRKTLLGALLSCSTAQALPEGGQVIQGQVQVVQPNANILQILQSSPTGIINWGSFSVNANQLVQFLQPNSSAALLNRVVGQSPSEILGQIQANGRILLVNPNGILFGPGSSVDAGSFLASTLAIQDQDFLQGRYDLHWDGTSPLRAIVNQGEIKVADGGFLALVSPLIDNQGLLVAQSGQIVLGATRQATLTVDARGMLEVSIPNGFASYSAPSTEAPQAVLLTPGQMSEALAGVVRLPDNPEGERFVQTAQGVSVVGGEGVLVNQGQILADASLGTAGTILLDSSQSTVLAPNGLLSASSQHGDAGSIYALSAGNTYQNGAIQARSTAAGNGGFVEVSGRGVQLTRGADLTATEGRAGRLLIDPANITIVSSGGGAIPVDDLLVDASALNTPGSVILEATNDLFIDDNVQVNLDHSTQLHLAAANNFDMRPGSVINGTNAAASVNITAGNDAFVRDIRVPTTNIDAGNRVELRGSQDSNPITVFGQPTTPTVLNITAGTDILNLDRIRVVGTHANVTQAAPDVFLFPGAQLDLAANTANVSLNSTGPAAVSGVVFSEDASIHSATGANITLSSTDSNVNFQDRSALNLAGPSTVNVTTPNGIFFLNTGTAINATDPASVLTVSGLAQSNLRTNILVPTSHLDLTGSVTFTNSTVGTPGSPTLLNVTSGSVFFDDATIQGTGAVIRLQSNTEARFAPGSPLHIAAPTASLNVTATGVVVLDDNARITADGPADIAFTSTTDNIFLNSGSQINLSGPSTFTTNSPNGGTSLAGSTINATDPGSSVNMSAGGQLTLGNLRVPTSNLNSTVQVEFRDSTVGTATSPTVVNVTTPGRINHQGDNRIIGSSLANLSEVGEQVTFDPGAKLSLTASAANVILSGNIGVIFNGDNRLTSSAPIDLALASSSGDVFLGNGSRFDLSGPANVTINSGLQTTLLQSATINATDPGSSVNISAGGQLTLGNLLVPTSNLHSNDLVRFQASTVGTPAIPTVLNVTGGNIFFDGANTVQGSNANIDLAATDTQVVIGADSQLRIVPSGSSLNVTANNGPVALGTNASISADSADISLASSNSSVILDANSEIDLSGPSTVTINSPGGATFLAPGATINAPSSASSVNISSSGRLTVANLLVPTSSLHSDELVQFQNGTIGTPGSPTVLNVTAGGMPDGIAIFAGSNLDIQGTSAEIRLNSPKDIFIGQDSRVRLLAPNSNLIVNATTGVFQGSNTSISASGAANISMTTSGGDILLREGSSISVAGAGNVVLTAPTGSVLMTDTSTIQGNGQANLFARNRVSVGNLRVPTSNLNSTTAAVDFQNSTLGLAGSNTLVNVTSVDVGFAIGSITELLGNQVDFEINALQDILVFQGATVNLQGNNNQVLWDATRNNVLVSNATISGNGATRFELRAGGQVVQQVDSSVSLPSAASNVSLTSTGTLFVNRVTTGGKLSATVTAGNVRLTDQLRANDLNLNISGELIAQPGARQPSLVGDSSLNVSAARISGPIDDPATGLVKALAFASGPSAEVRFQVTGTNNSLTGDRAANLFYDFPQSNDIQIVNPSGEVLLVNQAPPPVPPEPAPAPPAPQSAAFSFAQLVELERVTNQNENQFANPVLPSTLTTNNEFGLLLYSNPALTQGRIITLSAVLLDQAILPPREGESEASVRSEIDEVLELESTREVMLDNPSTLTRSEGEWQTLLSPATIEVVSLFPEASASAIRKSEEELEAATSLSIAGNDEDPESRYWRKLIEGIILWESD